MRRLATRILALDIGEKRIGVALSDPGGILASPLTIVERCEEKRDIEAVVGIASQYQVGLIIVGLPRTLGGSLGEQAEKVQAFARVLAAASDVPLVFRDERLTTVSARRLMRAGGGRKSRKKDRDDAVAAAVLLQGYLEEDTGE